MSGPISSEAHIFPSPWDHACSGLTLRPPAHSRPHHGIMHYPHHTHTLPASCMLQPISYPTSPLPPPTPTHTLGLTSMSTMRMTQSRLSVTGKTCASVCELRTSLTKPLT